MRIPGKLFLCITLAAAWMPGAPPKVEVTAEVRAVLDRISANSLRGNLSFLASDLLEGRDTPSRGLDIAAEFIASQFRRAGLEPGGDDEYFQIARMVTRKPNLEGFTLELSVGGQRFTATAADVSVSSQAALDLVSTPLVKLEANAPAPDIAALSGKVVIADSMSNQLRDTRIRVVILIDRSGTRRGGVNSSENSPVRINLRGEEAAKFFDALKPDASATVSVHMAAPSETTAIARNVVGILRGSDDELKNSYVLVSAHYDHLGAHYNGANDDGSGTVSVIELASALGSMQKRAKRSILFVAFFGEEKGLVGSKYYASHPMFPLDRTVAGVNIEQVGRTDGDGGEHKSSFNVTGFDYSTVTDYLVSAGEATGMNVTKNERASDMYFAASDNYPLAGEGVPAHTVSVTYIFPDYHRPGDEWRKIDYDNMARVDRTVALAVIAIADSAETPRWNADNPKAAKFAKKRPL